jgi:XTP/dITP diphosphohydrolase
MKICFATHNQHKLSEIAKLAPEGVTLVSLTDLNQTEEIPETGTTLEENSMLKAKYVFDKFGIACFADDTGLEVTALNGEPGVYSARYAGEQKDNDANMALLMKNLQGKVDRSAAFKTVITYINESGQSQQFVGQVKGEITLTKSGLKGFGYDPIFQPEGENQTFAEMSADAKNAISHRGRAFQKFIAFLNQK